MPIHISMTKKKSHARTPRMPVVTKKEGINPTPDANSVFQNMLSFISRGLYLSQALLNALGPVPKKGELFTTSLSMCPVVPHAGLTSTLVIMRAPDILAPRVLPEMMNIKDMMRSARAL